MSETRTTCTWVEDDPNGHMAGTWEGDCDMLWTFTEGGPKENEMNFCPKCGKQLVEREFEEVPEPEDE